LLASASALAQPAHIRDLLAESRGEIDLMVLLLNQNLAYLLGKSELSQCFALSNPLLVIQDRDILALGIAPR
jgi:hypothetical protein